MIKLSSIKPNPTNPRIIKDDKFKKLVQSIKDFPKMMELRPMVVNSDEEIQRIPTLQERFRFVNEKKKKIHNERKSKEI